MLDLYYKNKRTVGKKIDGWREQLSRLRSASRHERAGEWEAALQDRAHLVRYVQDARENVRSYQAIDEMIAAHPAELGKYRVDDVRPERFVFFVGHGRSGHSLVGSLLDAHPHVAISHELHALLQFKRGYDFDEVVKAIKYNASFFHLLGRNYTGYDYVVPGQHQGSYDRLVVIGDKKGNGTVRELRKTPRLWDELEERIPVPLHFINVIRNPYDNIATKATRRNTSLRYAYRGYFRNVDGLVQLKERFPGKVIDVYLDDLMSEPKSTLDQLLNAIGVDEVSDEYLEACASILFTKPSRTREKFDWDPQLVKEIEQRFREVDFLRRFANAE